MTIENSKKINKKVPLIGKSMVLLAGLFISNFVLGTISFQVIFSVVQEFEVGGILFSLLPGAISTAFVYFIYLKVPFMKPLAIPPKVFKTYMLIQGIVMMVVEPVALFISIMATDAPGSGVKEQMYGFTFIWLPVNGVLWLGLFLSLLMTKDN